jgi:hypothetical protein
MMEDDTQNILTVDLSEDEDLDDHERNYWTDTVVRWKQGICWPDFVSIRRKGLTSK